VISCNKSTPLWAQTPTDFTRFFYTGNMFQTIYILKPTPLGIIFTEIHIHTSFLEINWKQMLFSMKKHTTANVFTPKTTNFMVKFLSAEYIKVF
jgi:hypothetical protein